MAPILGAVVGALWGAFLVRKRGGNAKDMAQYAGGFAILFAIIGLFLAIFMARFTTGG